MIPGKVLYWGDNGAHEFWESVDHELLILRNRGESHWTAHRSYGFLFGSQSDIEAANRLNAVLSETHQWVREGKKFVLEPYSENKQKSLNLDCLSAKS